MTGQGSRKRGKEPVTDIANYRPKRKRAGNLNGVLIAVFLLACAAGGYFFSISPFFKLAEIQVTGNDTVSQEKAVQLSGLEIGSNIFGINTDRTAQYLSIDPNIKRAVVKKKYPSTISITLIEREPAVIVPTGNGFVYVADDAIVVSRHKQVSSLQYPLLTGVSGFPMGIVPGTPIESPSLEAGIYLAAQLPEDSISMIAEINVSNTQNILLYTVSGVEVRLGDKEDIKNKYNLMLTIMEELVKNSKMETAKYVDVSIPEKPVIYY